MVSSQTVRQVVKAPRPNEQTCHPQNLPAIRLDDSWHEAETSRGTAPSLASALDGPGLHGTYLSNNRAILNRISHE